MGIQDSQIYAYMHISHAVAMNEIGGDIMHPYIALIFTKLQLCIETLLLIKLSPAGKITKSPSTTREGETISLRFL